MRKPASVHIDIAEFAMTVMETPLEDRGAWVTSLVKSLSYADPTLNEFGAKLLDEVEAYRESERKRKEKYSTTGETRKDTERHGKTKKAESDTTVSKTDSKTEQKESKEKVSKDSKNLIAHKPENVEQQIWDEWMLIKKKKSQVFTSTALTKFESRAKAFGLTTQKLIEVCIDRGWASAVDDYLLNAGFSKNSQKKSLTYNKKTGKRELA